MAAETFDMFAAETRWDQLRRQDILASGKPTPFLAKRFGLTIHDWDGKLKSRVIGLDTDDLFLPFQYIEQVPNWEKSSSWNAGETPIGRFEPVQVYSNGEAQEIPLSLTYHAESYDDDGAWSLKWIETLVNRIKSLEYPMCDDEFSAPPKCLLNIGSIYTDVPVIVKGVTVENPGPFDWRTGLSMIRKVTLTCSVSYPMWQSIGMTQVFASADSGGKVTAYRRLPAGGYNRSKYVGGY